jgi:hypothetical protein
MLNLGVPGSWFPGDMAQSRGRADKKPSLASSRHIQLKLIVEGFGLSHVCQQGELAPKRFNILNRVEAGWQKNSGLKMAVLTICAGESSGLWIMIY